MCNFTSKSKNIWCQLQIRVWMNIHWLPHWDHNFRISTFLLTHQSSIKFTSHFQVTHSYPLMKNRCYFRKNGYIPSLWWILYGSPAADSSQHENNVMENDNWCLSGRYVFELSAAFSGVQSHRIEQDVARYLLGAGPIYICIHKLLETISIGRKQQKVVVGYDSKMLWNAY